MDYKKELEKMRERYRKKPMCKEILPRPRWMKPKDKLCSIFKEKDILFQKGTVYYAHIVQANEILFKFFPHYDCPACLVYSTDAIGESNPSSPEYCESVMILPKRYWTRNIKKSWKWK